MRAPNMAFVGMPGSGKSYAALVSSEHHLHRVHLDPMDSARIPGHGSRRGERWSHVFSGKNYSDLCDLMRSGRTYNATLLCGDMTPDEMEPMIAEVFSAAKGTAPVGEWTTVIVEEVGILIPRNTKRGMPVHAALRGGRHHRTCVYLVSQRAVDLDPTMRAMMDEVQVRRQYETRDLSALDEIRKGLGAAAFDLKGHEFMRIRAGQVTGPHAAI